MDVDGAKVGRSAARRAGNEIIIAKSQGQVQTFFDELKNGTSNYRTVASLGEQVVQEYRGRCVLELLQNAHDALVDAGKDDPRRIAFVLKTSPEPVLLVANSGRPFRREDFDGISQLGVSPKDPNESIGNKGLGFRSVLEVSSSPEIWSTPPSGSSTAFCFHFDPDMPSRVAEAAKQLVEKGADVRTPIDSQRPLVDWPPPTIARFQERWVNGNLDAAAEALHLSPYQFLLPNENIVTEVESLLDSGYATVVRLPLDGGRYGKPDQASRSVKEQLNGIDATAMVFLDRLEKLVIEVDSERRVLERVVDSNRRLSCPKTCEQRLLVGCSDSTAEVNSTRQFYLWARDLGGEANPDQAEEIRKAVVHLPNRWPEIQRLSVGIAVEDGPKPATGVFVIFLPTQKLTGTGACINAPFYGSLDRRGINFEDPYNDLVLGNVLKLCIDVVTELVAEAPQAWRARAVIDILASTKSVDSEHWKLMDRLIDRASKGDHTLDEQSIILCSRGWCLPTKTRFMPDIGEDDPLGASAWHKAVQFDVISPALEERLKAVGQLVDKLGGSCDPTDREWKQTVECLARQISTQELEFSWDELFRSLTAVLPQNLKNVKRWQTDPLKECVFLPASDKRLLNASDQVKLFFQPVQGIDDAAEFVSDIPPSLREHITFLNPTIQVLEQEEDGTRRNTEVREFLDGRFVKNFRREDVIKEVLNALPELPVPFDSEDAQHCLEIFTWMLKLLGEDELEGVLELLKKLPVACQGGWFHAQEAVFGPGWSDRLGDLLIQLSDDLPEQARERLQGVVLLDPKDERWGASVKEKDSLLLRAGVFDGLRLQKHAPIPFYTNGRRYFRLPNVSPNGIPQVVWDDWCEAVGDKVDVPHVSSFQYHLSDIRAFPEVQNLGEMSFQGLAALSKLILGSMRHWPAGWQDAEIRKLFGNPWRCAIKSPLRYWLETEGWLVDGPEGGAVVDGSARENAALPLSDRWLIPPSELGQQRRFSHLNALSKDLALKLEREPNLKDRLVQLGLNVYPVEQEKTGPKLLEALADAWNANRIGPELRDAFLGQVRHAWRHFDSDLELPDTFLIRTGRNFCARASSQLADVYLPNHRDKTRSLLDNGKPVLEMLPDDAHRLAEKLRAATEVRMASGLEEQYVVDGEHQLSGMDGGVPLAETNYASWLPIVLLSLHAYGGANPRGPTTKAWRESSGRIRSARILECEVLRVELADDGKVIASANPEAAWWEDGHVLVVRRGEDGSMERLAPAAQAMLRRQDLLKDLRLVLNTIDQDQEPTMEIIEDALDRNEIDALAVRDVRTRWDETTAWALDRVRPVLVLLGVPMQGFEEAGVDGPHLAGWLSENVPGWPAADLLKAAQRCKNDHEMGKAAWRVLGEIAQLPKWNEALASLGGQYNPVKNDDVGGGVGVLLQEATLLLRGLARHVAIEAGDAGLFRQIEEVTQSFRGRDGWDKLWWEVPFGAVIAELRADYANVVEADSYFSVLGGINTVDDLRDALQAQNIDISTDPYEVARTNKNELSGVLGRMHVLYRAWARKVGADNISSGPPSEPRVGADAYLRKWVEADLIERAIKILDDRQFAGLLGGCKTINEVRICLELKEEDIEFQEHRQRKDREEGRRQRRTFDVAGKNFDIEESDYTELFKRLTDLPDPDGPDASNDIFTPLDVVSDRGRGPFGGGGGGVNAMRQKISAAQRNLIGIVGEIHAYRFLRLDFGSVVVGSDAWVSENRQVVLPLVEGEPDETCDAHGFDFRFPYRGEKWFVEVKATSGDDTYFDLGITEIEAASRFARRRGANGGRWRILRIRKALTERPEFDWLPNPFEDDHRKRFRLHKGGMRVSYFRITV